MRERPWLLPLYWALAALPLAAAFWAYLRLPAMIYVTPTLPIPSGRAGVWPLPALNAALGMVLYVLSGRMCKTAQTKALEQDRPTDIGEILPGIRLYVMTFLSALALAVVYGHYTLEGTWGIAPLLGQVAAFMTGIGTALFALQLPRATKNNILALHWRYTEQSPQVWLKVHKLATPILYLTGALMLLTAVLLDGLWAALTAAFALFSALFALYLYAKRLYEDEFRH